MMSVVIVTLVEQTWHNSFTLIMAMSGMQAIEMACHLANMEWMVM